MATLQHGPSVFGIVKGHALHDSRQLFKVLSLLQLHVVHSGYLRAKFPAQRPRKNLRSQIGTVAGQIWSTTSGLEVAVFRQFQEVIQSIEFRRPPG